MFGDVKRKHFQMLMRIQENFLGCRVLSYCVVFNRCHILLEVRPMRQGGISDAELLKQLAAAYSDAFVARVAKELAEARVQEREPWVAEIHARSTHWMHDLSEFMKTLLRRSTRWFNRAQRDAVGGAM